MPWLTMLTKVEKTDISACGGGIIIPLPAVPDSAITTFSFWTMLSFVCWVCFRKTETFG